jgi:3D (Asp-Asp-Asp) domain-containing protein
LKEDLKNEEPNKKDLKGSKEKKQRRKVILKKALIASLIINCLWGIGLYRYKNIIVKQDGEIKALQALKIEQKTKTEEIENKLKDNEKLIKEKEKLIKNTEKEVQEKNKEIEELKKKQLINKSKVSTSNRGAISRGVSIPQIFEVSMYTKEGGAYPKDSPYYGLMTSGKKVYKGAVAVPRDIPFGSKIILKDLPDEWEYLESTYTAEDRGGAIIVKEEKLENLKLSKDFISELEKHNQIFYKDGIPYVKVRCVDIYTPNLEEANNWGRRKVQGYLVRG